MHHAIRAQLARGAAACCLLLASTIAPVAAPAPARAETTVRLMHVDTNPKNVAVWRKIADQYEATHAGVKIDLQFLENESFKAKLPTLLQSKDAPDLFYSWSGGVLKAQFKAGAVQDLTEAMRADGGAWAKAYKPAAVRGVTIDGRVLCVPYKMSVIGFFYNKALFAKAGVDADAIRSWTDLAAAVKALKAAGITPIAAGGGDKWPLHFYWSYLVLRLGGEDTFRQAKAGEGGGFTAKPFVAAFETLRQFGELAPFQPGYLGTRWQDSLAIFGDGRAAMILSFDDTDNRQRAVAADGKGIPRDQLGIFSFPMVAGGAGAATETFGGVNCWAASRNASPAAIDFARYFTSRESEEKMAATGMLIPAAAGADAALQDPFVRAFADKLGASTFHQIFLDQDLGPSVGRVVNDVTVEVVSGSMPPADAIKQIQDAFELE